MARCGILGREQACYRGAIRQVLIGARAPKGLVRFNSDAVIDDIFANESRYSHPLNARPVGVACGPVERRFLPDSTGASPDVPRVCLCLTATRGLLRIPMAPLSEASRERLADDIHDGWSERRRSVPEDAEPGDD